MGIPSYYRFLCQKNKNIIQTDYESKNKSVLCLDFNCIVYYCLSKMDEYNENHHDEYERKLINEVCKYVEHIYISAKKPNELFIAVDGVVPMAKMKQQRLRRFKSMFMAPYEIAAGVRNPEKKSWDKDSITPGTLFMVKLDKALNELCKKHVNWVCSGFNDPGEGEHKVMNFIRNYKDHESTTFLVYGLDADLILLSMLQSINHTIFLMREETEFNNVVMDVFNKEQFLYLNIQNLNSTLFEKTDESYIQDYIMMMSLLGNDFLPHSLSLTIKDGGHTILFNTLKMFHKKNKFLVKNKTIQWKVLKEFIGSFYEQEADLIKSRCKKKSQIHTYKGKSEYEQKMASTMILPCSWFIENVFYDKEINSLKNNWEEIYYEKFLNGNTETIISEYLKGLQWILDYYNGVPIEYDWYYPYNEVPLWKDIYSYLDSFNNNYRFKYTYEKPIKPEQQLAIVLPAMSYFLIPYKEYYSFPSKYPQYFPTKFSLNSLGKKWIYEAEPSIPIISSKLIRKIF